ncbi:MAG TPA: class I SAM-dependent methyltransferase [Gemmataceae bacterium]|jgi:SAM-dependent methyltransferase|nr:class I SAM-dependent methyltransferase [Gemmataceae bacterium]
MPDLAQTNPTGRFAGLAKIYSKCRPGYPQSALNFILQHCGLKSGSLLVDVGSGTGISSRLFAERGLQVVGIEPNADMRATAIATPGSCEEVRPTYREGRAEATGLATGSADAVLAAQAFHWFEAEPALREFQRILKPGGWGILVWNERDERDPFTAAYGAVVRTAPEAAAVEGPRAQAGQALLRSPLFQNATRSTFANEQTVDEEGLLGRAFSASYAPREPEQAEAFAAALRDVFARYQQAGKVAIKYETSVYLAAKAPAC